ncbi:uncharacterized protein [Arachis hypogaea]|uniref:uncharacterized protein n=1 Tax=Arachis hypogaea TaxID=3818 RepID=UPI003B21487D
MEKRAAEGGRAADCSRRWVLVPRCRRSCSQSRWSLMTTIAGEREGARGEERGALSCVPPSHLDTAAATASSPSPELDGCCPCQQRRSEVKPPPCLLSRSAEKELSPPRLVAGKPRCRRRKTLPAPLPESGRRCNLRWLPGCCRTGSETAAVSIQSFLLRFGKRFDLKALLLLFCNLTLRFVTLIAIRLSFSCYMLRLELLRLLRKWRGAEVLADGILIVDLGSRRKGFCDAFGLWFCVSR